MRTLASLALILALFFGVSPIINAEETPTPAQAQQIEKALTPEQEAVIRTAVAEAVKTIRAQHGAQVQQRQESGAKDLNWTELADKVLTNIGPYVAQIAATVQKAAPHVYEIMVRQQKATAIARITVPIGITIILLLYMLIAGWRWKGDCNDCEGGKMWCVYAIPTVLLLINGLWFANRVADSIQMLYNPEYYAIRDIVYLVIGR